MLEYGLKYRDLERLRDTLPTVIRSLPISLLRKDAQHGRRRISNARILGTTPQILQVKNLKLRRGRFLTDTDLKITANVCVLAAGAAQRLFGYEDPLEKNLLLGSSAYTVVGVLKSAIQRRREAGWIEPGQLQQRHLYSPYRGAETVWGTADDRAGRVDGIRTDAAQ